MTNNVNSNVTNNDIKRLSVIIYGSTLGGVSIGAFLSLAPFDLKRTKVMALIDLKRGLWLLLTLREGYGSH